jgi:hypothetical protein
VELVDAIADRLVASGIGTARYSTSGTSVQVNVRRETGADTIVLLTQRGGTAYPGQREDQTFQVLVDATTVSGAQAKARAVFDHLHGLVALTLSGHDVLWIRAVTPPQAVPHGPGESERFQFSVNFDAFVRKAGSY